MLLSTLVIGLLTAYYFGLRPAAWAAGSAVALMIAAIVLPSYATVIYGALAVGIVGVAGLGPKYQRPGARKQADRAIRWAWRRGRQLLRERTDRPADRGNGAPRKRPGPR